MEIHLPFRWARAPFLGVALLCTASCPDRDPPPAEQVTRTPHVAGSGLSHRAGSRPGIPRRSLLVPPLAPPSCAERAFDAAHVPALRSLISSLHKTFDALRAIARRGAAEPTFRKQWARERNRFLLRVGRRRAAVLGVDPLGRRSFAARAAIRLVDSLELELPAAVPESWSARPSGAWNTWQQDFLALWARLKAYVDGLDPSRPCARRRPAARRGAHLRTARLRRAPAARLRRALPAREAHEP